MMGFSWIMSIVIGALAGLAAEKIMNFNTGLAMNIVLGIAGAIIGNAILGMFGMMLGGILGQFIVAAAGACLLIYVYRAIKGRPAA